MKFVFYGAYLFFSMVSRFFEKLAVVFNKAAAIIRPRNTLEWTLLIAAIIIPFGLTAYIIYKIVSREKITQ
ncbi:MAG: hypothetical protein AVO33_03390 [delta proteobacterium ML8_F1]|nr:MAG: hypothetical protein AVO33_03390 [delta proteobacterium ML8_F1]